MAYPTHPTHSRDVLDVFLTSSCQSMLCFVPSSGKNSAYIVDLEPDLQEVYTSYVLSVLQFNCPLVWVHRRGYEVHPRFTED